MKEKAAKQEQHQPSKQNGKVDEFGIPLPSNDSYRYVLAYMRGVYSTCVPTIMSIYVHTCTTITPHTQLCLYSSAECTCTYSRDQQTNKQEQTPLRQMSPQYKPIQELWFTVVVYLW